MGIQSRTYFKNKFVTGYRITANDYDDWLDSVVFQNEAISGITWDQVSGKPSLLDTTAHAQINHTGLPGIPSAYTHPNNHSPSIISQDSNNRFVTDVEKSRWNMNSVADFKTINSQAITGIGDISTTIDFKTINGNSVTGVGDIVISTGVSSVYTDSTLTGDGTSGNPLSLVSLSASAVGAKPYKELRILASTTGYGSPTLIEVATYGDIAVYPGLTSGMWFSCTDDASNNFFYNGSKAEVHNKSQYGISPYIIGTDPDVTRFVTDQDLNLNIYNAYIAVPDVTPASRYNNSAWLNTLNADEQFEIDSSTCELYFGSDAGFRGEYHILPHCNNGYKFADKHHVIVEFYPNGAKGSYDSCGWSLSGDDGIIFRDDTIADGFGNVIERNSNGYLSRYTLSETQYNELNSKIGKTFQDTAGTFTVSNIAPTTSINLMNQTWFLNNFHGDPSGSNAIFLVDTFSVGARVRFVDVSDDYQLIILPVWHTIIGASDVIGYSTDGIHRNTATNLYYVRTYELDYGDTVEFQYVGSNCWRVQFFDFAAYADGAIPWSKVDKTGAIASQILFTPSGNIAAINVQTAIEELDSEKVPLNNYHYINQLIGGII